ncbi:hypothetical protein SAMN05421636_102309 [Pricia antarctica]|uniref:Uncharacterized protein n=1 Tax=Pricia antarctica TaxID=641691 RepID=A0A1G6YMM3_9FLAO|nr:hypothetical protein [Pricia antarctica]SDD91659.1 hypothetical protein SAMN05421636_102309 [Pricia antarctica]
MENILKKGDLVSYYDGGYTGRIINEDGEMDIWDWHLYSSGRILTTFEKYALVLLYSDIDENPRPYENIVLDEVSVIWISTKHLSKEPEKE